LILEKRVVQLGPTVWQLQSFHVDVEIIESSKANMVRTKPDSFTFVTKINDFAVLFHLGPYDVTLLAHRTD
jgi:hypothetical protein